MMYHSTPNELNDEIVSLVRATPLMGIFRIRQRVRQVPAALMGVYVQWNSVI